MGRWFLEGGSGNIIWTDIGLYLFFLSLIDFPKHIMKSRVSYFLKKWEALMSKGQA